MSKHHGGVSLLTASFVRNLDPFDLGAALGSPMGVSTSAPTPLQVSGIPCRGTSNAFVMSSPVLTGLVCLRSAPLTHPIRQCGIT